MHFLKAALLLTLCFAFTAPAVLAKQEAAAEQGLGEKLLRQFWENMQKSDMEQIEKTLAKGFQSVHQYGAHNREQEIELIKGLKLGNYILSNIEVTRNGPVIVASYFVSVEETIKGERLQKKPEPRLTVFLKTGSDWQLIAHANLRPLK